MVALVDFFVIGVQKGGTTALAHHLRQHPAIQMSRVKEVHHFDNETLDWSQPDHARLHEQFDWQVEGVLRGEATPIYIYWPKSLPRIRAYNSAAKLIIGLRHPSFRTFSHWRMEAKRGAEELPFEQAISEAGRDRVRNSPESVHRVYSYVERGFYHGQIARLLELFPRRQIHFFRTDELWTRPGAMLDAICEFLNIDRTPISCTEQRYVVPVNASDLGDLPVEARSLLDAMFRDDIRLTAKLVGLDLDDWLETDYREPMRPACD